MWWPACILQWVEGDELERHSIENHSHIAQWIEQLTCEVVGLNPAGEPFF